MKLPVVPGKSYLPAGLVAITIGLSLFALATGRSVVRAQGNPTPIVITLTAPAPTATATVEPTPSPTAANPMSAVVTVGMKMASSNPAVAIRPPN